MNCPSKTWISPSASNTYMSKNKLTVAIVGCLQAQSTNFVTLFGLIIRI